MPKIPETPKELSTFNKADESKPIKAAEDHPLVVAGKIKVGTVVGFETMPDPWTYPRWVAQVVDTDPELGRTISQIARATRIVSAVQDKNPGDDYDDMSPDDKKEFLAAVARAAERQVEGKGGFLPRIDRTLSDGNGNTKTEPMVIPARWFNSYISHANG